MSTTTQKPWTADELGRLPEGWRYEIDEGELIIMAPAGYEHARVQSRITRLLGNYVEANDLGEIVGGEAGFRLQRVPETLRGVDVAFLSRERSARIGRISGFPDVPPDLAVEVHDPSEPDLGRKVEQYLAAGVRAVWVVDPRARTLTRYAPSQKPRTVSDAGGTVEEAVLPGFSCRLRDLFGD